MLIEKSGKRDFQEQLNSTAKEPLLYAGHAATSCKDTKLNSWVFGSLTIHWVGRGDREHDRLTNI